MNYKENDFAQNEGQAEKSVRNLKERADDTVTDFRRKKRQEKDDACSYEI